MFPYFEKRSIYDEYGENPYFQDFGRIRCQEPKARHRNWEDSDFGDGLGPFFWEIWDRILRNEQRNTIADSRWWTSTPPAPALPETKGRTAAATGGHKKRSKKRRCEDKGQQILNGEASDEQRMLFRAFESILGQ